MPLVDVHCHLDAPVYHDVSDVCQHSRQAGVTVTVAAGTGLRSNARILALQAQEPGQVWAALGLHPERLDASWEELEAVIAQVQEHRQRVVALGEIAALRAAGPTYDPGAGSGARGHVAYAGAGRGAPGAAGSPAHTTPPLRSP